MLALDVEDVFSEECWVGDSASSVKFYQANTMSEI